MAKKVIISGGGTGGHIFPAIAIANALKTLDPQTEILFVGATGKMEMEKVPAAGYEIVGLDIQGINRKELWKNFALPFKLLKSLVRAREIIKDFKPDVAVGVGGFASGPLLKTAASLGVPTLIQEQNSYAGVTNKNLGKKADKICVAFDGMDAFFPRRKILLTGNPIRRSAVDIEGRREEAIHAFGLDMAKQTILVTGGSLGARTLNDCMVGALKELGKYPAVQVIWQCGGFYYEVLQKRLENSLPDNVKMLDFLQRMDYAYAAADVIIARAGAGTISELCAVGKPVILVPSPNVAEDHQTKNALSLVHRNAALLVKDEDAKASLISRALALLENEEDKKILSTHIRELALVDADRVIAQEVLKLADHK